MGLEDFLVIARKCLVAACRNRVSEISVWVDQLLIFLMCRYPGCNYYYLSSMV